MILLAFIITTTTIVVNLLNLPLPLPLLNLKKINLLKLFKFIIDFIPLLIIILLEFKGHLILEDQLFPLYATPLKPKYIMIY